MQPHLVTLANGLRVIFADTKAFPSATTLLLVGAGSRYENKNNNGIAHFFEHMAFKGSQKYPDSLTIASIIEGAGGLFNAFTAKDHTGYWIKSTVAQFPTVIDVLSDMILRPRLLAEEIEREKGVISEEINMYEDTPQRRVGELYEELLYDGQALGFEIAGKKETVQSFTRETFTNYMDSLYHPANALLVVAGGLERIKNYDLGFKNYLSIIQEKFKDWQDGQKSQFAPVKETQQKPGLFIKYKKTEQAHFCLGFRAFSFFDNRKYALVILAALLGGGMSSRLFIEVRERRGLCYYISTGRELYHDTGNLITQAGVTVKPDKVKSAVQVILEQHRQIAQGRVKESELRRAKELVKGRLILSLEDSFSVAALYGGQMILENRLKTGPEIMAGLEKVSLDEIVQLASDLFTNERLNMAIIGPFENKEEFKEALWI